MNEDNLIRAEAVKCSTSKCKKMGYRWIVIDPDIKPFVLCEQHIFDFRMRLLSEIEASEK